MMASPVIKYLAKSSNTNQPLSTKFRVDCKQITSDEPTTESWLTVSKRLAASNFEDKNRLLLGHLKSRDGEVVVKVGESTTLLKEYEIGGALALAGIDGFIRYDCFFKCDDDYRELPRHLDSGICKGPGERMSVLVMPYYAKGNLGEFDFRKKGVRFLHRMLRQVYDAFVDAFLKVGFVHNDSHARNILLDDVGAVVIMDFENAMKGVAMKHKRFVYKDFGRLVADLHFNNKLNLDGARELMTTMMRLEESDIELIDSKKEVYERIDALAFADNRSNPFVYNPDRY